MLSSDTDASTAVGVSDGALLVDIAAVGEDGKMFDMTHSMMVSSYFRLICEDDIVSLVMLARRHSATISSTSSPSNTLLSKNLRI